MSTEEVPKGRCGFVLQREDVGVSSVYSTVGKWHERSEAVCCWRKPRNETGPCVWHDDVTDKPVDELQTKRTKRPERFDGAKLTGVEADRRLSFAECTFIGGKLSEVNVQGANFRDASLRDADLHGSNLKGGDFTDATLSFANLGDAKFWNADLTNADIRKSSFRGSDLRKADFVDANLRDADFEDADLQEADLRRANLEDGSLVQTDLREASLRDARFYQTYFSDVRINSDTEFGDTCVYEDLDELEDWDATPTEAAVWTYRRLQDLHEKYALTERARHYHVKKKESQKRRHREEGNYFQWAIHAVNGIASKHGESPWRVVGVSGGIIVVWSALYLLLGQILVPDGSSGMDAIGLGLFPSISLPTLIAKIATSLYFSVVTFTTLGYGDLQPASGFAQALATVESFLGALLMAYLVFVLGRRTNW